MGNKGFLSLDGLLYYTEKLISEVKTKLDAKKNIVNVVTDIETPLVLSDNTEYRLTDVSSLEISYPDGNFEVWMNVSFSPSETIVVTFPAETKYIGAAPTFGNGQTWEISIKDGVAVCWRVE